MTLKLESSVTDVLVIKSSIITLMVDASTAVLRLLDRKKGGPMAHLGNDISNRQ